MADFDFMDGLAIATPIVTGLMTNAAAKKDAREAAIREKQMQAQLEQLERNRQDIINPYSNLAVATQAAEMQAEQADISLANTLDTLAATGAGAGGATALSKKGISASLEQQEVANEKLRAQGELQAFTIQETREKQKLDRTADLLDRETMQKFQYEQDAMAALTGAATGVGLAYQNYKTGD
mgnify:CR=1 FL=1